jgi:DICT domain-containing protein
MAASAKEQIDVAAALVRLYVFLAQYLDRCFDEAARASYPDAELQTHLKQTRLQLMEILAVNPVVKKKLAEECDRILALGTSCLKTGAADTRMHEAVQAERAILKTKTIALSDMVAVFRAME